MEYMFLLLPGWGHQFLQPLPYLIPHSQPTRPDRFRSSPSGAARQVATVQHADEGGAPRGKTAPLSLCGSCSR